MSNKTVSIGQNSWIYLIISVIIAMIGHTIHHSIFWSVMDFFFWPLALVKWLICHEISLSVIKQTFSFFLN